MFSNTKSVTLGETVYLNILKDRVEVVGDIPVELIDAETKFFDMQAAKVLRAKNFDAQKDAQVSEALYHADTKHRTTGQARYSRGGLNDDLDSKTKKSLREAKAAKNDNYIHLFDKQKKEFPIGLLNRVTNVLSREGISFEVTDKRTVPIREFEASLIDGWYEKARDYQLEGAVLTDKHNILLFDWATNSGKTLLMSLIFAKKGVKTLIITHSGHLAFQIRDAFEEYTGVKATMCQGGKVKLSPLTIAVVNTVYRNLGVFKEYGFEMVMVDEAHKSAAISYVKVLKWITPYYSYGFTGTAERRGGDNLVLEANYGNEHPKISNLEMIEQGYSCKVDVDFVEVDQTEEVNKLDPYSMVYKNAVVDSTTFNAVVIEEILRHVDLGRVIVVQVAQKAQGRLLQSFLTPDVPCVLVDGDSNGIENYKKLQDFKKGVYQVAIGTVINEGFDHDGLDVVINAAGFKAKGLTKQKLGRVLRIRDGKEKGYFVDFYSTGHPILEKHSRIRAETLEKEGFVVPILKIVREREAKEKAKILAEQAEANRQFNDAKRIMESSTRGIISGRALSKSKLTEIKSEEISM